MVVKIEVLGCLRASVAGVSFVPSASKQRQLLAMLAVNVGTLVTTTVLLDEMWDQEPPRSALPTLHTYVSSVRRRLQRVLAGDQRCRAKDILVTEHGGYRLNVPPEAVDAGEYHRLSTAGRRAIDNGDFAMGADTLRAALAMWEGPALADVVTGPRLEIELRRLQETRLSDLDLRINADLHMGRHQQLLGELAAMCAEFPLFESFNVQYMLALHRCGWRSRALDVYQSLRETMVSQLGLDPSTGVRRLHQAILRGDPVVDDPSAGAEHWTSANLPVAASWS
jgi:SARP family transcriptional regulator, regulator of embCAB operon